MIGTNPVNAKNEITCVRCSDAASQMFRTQGMACGQTLAPSEATMRDDAGKRKLKVVKNEERALLGLGLEFYDTVSAVLINASDSVR
jgi:hypothetical protein